MDHGCRIDRIADRIDRGGANNLISPYACTGNISWGQATSGYLVEVEKLDPDQMEEWRKTYPEAFEREYDPAYGLHTDAWIEGGDE
jgi:trimethylamine-N-oxide reductase (cytochrome c)